MLFTDGAHVRLSDRREVGQLRRIIIDPRSLEVTDIVVSTGDRREDEKVVPVDLVARSAEDEIELKDLPGGWEDLLPFREANYRMVSNQDTFLSARLMNRSAPILFIYPPAIPATGITYPRPDLMGSFSSTEENEPSIHGDLLPGHPHDILSLTPGSRVISQDRIELGYVERVLNRAEDGRAVFFVLKRGLLVNERKIVPFNWIDTVSATEVQLGVRARFLDWLPDELSD